VAKPRRKGKIAQAPRASFGWLTGMSVMAFLKQCPDDDPCWSHLERVRWPDRPVCPKCGNVGPTMKCGRVHYHLCKAGNAKFTVAMGTPLEGTHLAMRTSFTALYFSLSPARGCRAVFKAKLADLNERFGIEMAEINPAYTSQECERCGIVDRGNRKSQSEFRCLHCAHTARADVKGAKVVAKRRSLGLDFRFPPRGQVLGVLRKRFAERPGTQASSGRPAAEIPPRGNEAFFVGVKHGAYHECQ
jgi:Putative transposase DNA-binding domain/Transposase zinc-ribbon domain